MGNIGYHRTRDTVASTVWSNLIVMGNQCSRLILNLTEKIIEGVESAYSTQLAEISRDRNEQLAYIKSRIRTNPDEV